MIDIRGAKGSGGKSGGGGGSVYTPTTTPDNLDSVQYAEVLDLLCEGEIEGFPSAKAYARDSSVYNVALLKDIYLDNTPVLRAGANPAAPQSTDYNYQNLTILPVYGTQDQSYIPLSRTLQSEFAVGVKVEQAIPVTRTISTTGTNGVRITLSTPQLQQFTNTNDVYGNTINFAIDLSYNGGPFQRVVNDSFTGRTTDLYQREFRINFVGSLPVSVRVVRITPDFTTSNKIGDLYWTSYTEISYSKLRYPNSALVGLRVDARQFNNIPSRAYRIRGLKVRLPSNATVNQTTGAITYGGIWNGTFAQAQWTSDPSWCLYDLLTSKRYGTGNYIDSDKLDKWDFYAASQYCNQLVSNGFGGLEPRFSCNVNIQTQDEAYKLINQMASVFRAMPYWSAGSISMTQDRPQDSSYLFNPSNVTEQGFTYSGSALKTRHTVAIVKYFDINARDASFEVVEDHDAIVRYGVVKAEIDAFACTSRAQARRLGEWLLYSEQNETETVTFVTSIEAGIMVRPGQVIEIADPVRSGERTGGRIVRATSTVITVDSVDSISFSGNDPTLSIVLPDGSVEIKPVASRNHAEFTVSSAFSQVPTIGSVWIYQDTGIQTQLFRVLSVVEQDEISYSITALAHNPGKYDYIERDLPLVNRDITNLNQPPPPPTELKANELLYESNGLVLAKIILSWKPVLTATQYRIRYRVNNGNWITGETTAPDFEVLNSSVGNYSFEIYSVSGSSKASAATTLAFTAIGKTAPPSNIPDLFIAPIDDKSAELYWPQAVDIDVRIGGEIRIRHCPLTDNTASWGQSNDIVPSVPGAATRKIVPLLSGTYFIRAVDSLGNESADTANVVVSLPAPQDALLIQEYHEETSSPAFRGTTSNMAYNSDEGGLVLTASGLIDDMAIDGNWDGLSFIDYIGGSISQGSYQYYNVLDLGAVYDIDLRAILQTRAFEPSNFVDDRLAYVDDWNDIDGDDLGAVNTSLYVRTTADNPSGAPTWGNWQPFVNSTTRGRGFQFKMVADAANPGQNLVVSQLGVIATFERRTEQQRNLTSGTSTYTVTFPSAFYDVPSIGITAQDLGTGGYFTVSNPSRTGFQVTFKNSAGSIVSKVFDYMAVGHGRQIA